MPTTARSSSLTQEFRNYILLHIASYCLRSNVSQKQIRDIGLGGLLLCNKMSVIVTGKEHKKFISGHTEQSDILTSHTCRNPVMKC